MQEESLQHKYSELKKQFEASEQQSLADQSRLTLQLNQALRDLKMKAIDKKDVGTVQVQLEEREERPAVVLQELVQMRKLLELKD